MAKNATNKKTQLRRCGLCQKIGHNKSTCPEADRKTHSATSQPLRFFVHHVSYTPHSSPHVVNLKAQKYNAWENVQSVAPEETKNKAYYFYHETPTKNIPLCPDENVAKKTEAQNYQPFILSKNERAKKPIRKQLKQKCVSAARSASQLLGNLNNALASAGQGMFTNAKQLVRKKPSLRQAAAAIVLIAIIFLAPSRARTYYFDIKNTAYQIADNSTSGFMSLQDSTAAIMKGDIEDAQKSLTSALTNFNQAVAVLDNKHRLLQAITSVIPIVNNEIQSRQKLILAGQDISLGNTYLLKGLAEVKNNTSSSLAENIKIIGSYLEATVPNYEKALANLGGVEAETLPLEYQNAFKEFRILFSAFLGDLKNISQLNLSLQEIFGGKGLRRYLLVFQNPSEIRPTGGFMGSFALIDVKDGKIIKMDVPAGGSYDLQGQLKEYVEPPAPLLLSNKRWEFQDANWFADFPASAQKILWFYRHSRNITADGVIAINASVLNRILSVTGPVAEQKHNVVIAKENALPALQQIIEYGPEKQKNKPKQILSDLAPLFLNYFQNIKSQDILPILVNLQEALQQKEIQSYFTDADTEATIKNFGWAGQILDTNPEQDYLFVVNSNIQGQKSDAEITQNISHQAVIQPDGTIVSSVTITRTHSGQAGEKLYGQTNVDYIRVYVPQGSELVSASGFTWPDEQKLKIPETWYKKDIMLGELEKESGVDKLSGTRITQEFGKTAFANWIITEPGQTSEAQFIYKLPFKAFAPSEQNTINKWAKIFQSTAPVSKYQLVAQKQSGVNSGFESQIIYPEGWHPIWQDGKNIKLASNGAAISNYQLDKDTVWSFIVNKEEE